MATTSKRSLYIRALQAVQASVLEIIDDVSHVALYRFEASEVAAAVGTTAAANTGTGRWTRMDIEGSAYLTRNTEAPLYSFIVLNKKGEQDFIMSVAEQVDKVRNQDKYLMIRCKASGRDDNGNTSTTVSIFGIWIHDDEERQRLCDSLNGILAKSTQPGSNDLLNKLNSGLRIVSSNGVQGSTSAIGSANSTPQSAALLSLLKQEKSSSSSTDVFTDTSNSKSLPPKPPVVSSESTPSKLLLSVLKIEQNASQTPQSCTVPVDTSSSSLSSTTAITPASKSNQLLSFLKKDKDRTADSLDLLTDGQIAESLNKTTAVKKMPPTVSPAPPSSNSIVTPSVLSASKQAELKPRSLSIGDDNKPKSRSSSLGNDIVTKTSTPMKTESSVEAALLNQRKERSNSNSNLAAEESVSRKEVLKTFLISPSMLEG